MKALSVIIVVAGLAWIAHGVSALRELPETPRVLGFGPEFTGNAQLPANAIRQTFETARQRMLAANAAGRRFRILGDSGVWASFLASAGVTLILGWLGYVPTNQPAVPAGAAAPSPLKQPVVRWIGALAASAAVLTALGNLAQTYAERQYDRADRIQKHLIEARAEVLTAETADRAQAVLDALETETSRL